MFYFEFYNLKYREIKSCRIYLIFYQKYNGHFPKYMEVHAESMEPEKVCVRISNGEIIMFSIR